MGVDLGGIVPRKEIDFSYLSNKVVAIDAFNALYQFLSSIRGQDGNSLMDSRGNVTSHLQGLFTRSLNLMSKGIKLVYVFDGVSPRLKYKEQQERSLRKITAEQKYQTAVDDEDLDAMYKYSKQFTRLNSTMIEESKKLISAMGLPVVEAPSEAEGQVAYLCKKNLVDFSASQDFDSLLFGAPKLIRNLTLSQKRKLASGKVVYTFLEFLELDEILKELNFTQSQLIVLGILTGTDFNNGGIRGIGPRKALKLLKDKTTFDDFDTIFSDLKADFDWREIYDIFNNLPVTEKVSLTFNPLNPTKVKDILVDTHEFNLERIDKLLLKYTSENKLLNQKGLQDFF